MCALPSNKKYDQHCVCISSVLTGGLMAAVTAFTKTISELVAELKNKDTIDFAAEEPAWPVHWADQENRDDVARILLKINGASVKLKSLGTHPSDESLRDVIEDLTSKDDNLWKDQAAVGAVDAKFFLDVEGCSTLAPFMQYYYCELHAFRLNYLNGIEFSKIHALAVSAGGTTVADLENLLLETCSIEVNQKNVHIDAAAAKRKGLQIAMKMKQVRVCTLRG